MHSNPDYLEGPFQEEKKKLKKCICTAGLCNAFYIMDMTSTKVKTTAFWTTDLAAMFSTENIQQP